MKFKFTAIALAAAFALGAVGLTACVDGKDG